MGKPSAYQRGYSDGFQSLVRWLYPEFQRKRKGGIKVMDVSRFDSLVEKHITVFGLPKDPEAGGDAVPSDDQAG